MFTFNKVLKEYKDITKKVLFQKDLPKVFSENNNKKILMEFLDKNLNSDLVLDKINSMGINSLTEIDHIKIKKPTFWVGFFIFYLNLFLLLLLSFEIVLLIPLLTPPAAPAPICCKVL